MPKQLFLDQATDRLYEAKRPYPSVWITLPSYHYVQWRARQQDIPEAIALSSDLATFLDDPVLPPDPSEIDFHAQLTKGFRLPRSLFDEMADFGAQHSVAISNLAELAVRQQMYRSFQI